MRRTNARTWFRAALLVAVAVATIVGAPMIGLLLLPVFLLALLLLLGRYPGEELLVRLAGRGRTPSRPSRLRLPRAPRLLGRRFAPLATLGASRAPPLAS